MHKICLKFVEHLYMSQRVSSMNLCPQQRCDNVLGTTGHPWFSQIPKFLTCRRGKLVDFGLENLEKKIFLNAVFSRCYEKRLRVCCADMSSQSALLEVVGRYFMISGHFSNCKGKSQIFDFGLDKLSPIIFLNAVFSMSCLDGKRVIWQSLSAWIHVFKIFNATFHRFWSSKSSKCTPKFEKSLEKSVGKKFEAEIWCEVQLQVYLSIKHHKYITAHV